MNNQEDKDVKEFLEKTHTILNRSTDFLYNKRGAIQKLKDIQSGYMVKNGIRVPFGKHRFLYELYDLVVLRSYSDLFNQVFNNIDNVITAFSLRPLQEIGIIKIDILFGSELSGEEKKRFSLNDQLTDFISMSQDQYRQDFLKLYEEENQYLKAPEDSFFKEIYDMYSKGRFELDFKDLKKSRNNLNTVTNNLRQKITGSPFLEDKSDRLKLLHSVWSHLLHGNPIMLEMILNNKISWRTKYWVEAMLWMTGLNVLWRLKPHIDDKDLLAEIDNLFTKRETIWNKLMEGWESRKSSA